MLSGMFSASRRLARRGRDQYRLYTSRFRSLPHFLIIGAQKSGTTSLFSYLEQHSQILTSLWKEVHFFDLNYDKGASWYRSHFPVALRVRPGSRVGEASPYYLCHPHSPGRIHDLLPEVRLIAILRNPTERAISHYFHEVKNGREPLPIMKALQAEEGRISAEWQKMRQDEFYSSRAHQYFSYKQRGVYIQQLKSYWKYFDKEQLLALSSESLFRDPNKKLQEVFRFLGVDPNFIIEDTSAENISRNRTELSPAVYQYLDHFFRPYNEELYQHLGQAFDW